MTEPGAADDPFVSVLRSTDAQLVQAVIAALQAEGIRCEHPGLNHAGLLAGLSYIEVDLRVPQTRQADALALIGAMRPDEDEQELVGRATFRVRRANSALFVIVGLVLAIVANVIVNVLDHHFWPSTQAVLYGAAIVGGYALGQVRRADYCSRPDCGGPLRGPQPRCPKCKTPIRGELRFASEHFEAAEAWEKTNAQAAS